MLLPGRPKNLSKVRCRGIDGLLGPCEVDSSLVPEFVENSGGMVNSLRIDES